ncbi:HNH endonuclease, partial [Escherichia coli]|nr:HNH endonuclease [Escherichia coli]
VVDLCDSELDHRIALQFGGGNEETNLWTLCTECHRQKSVSETASGMPDPTLPEVMAGQTISSDCDPPRGGSSGEKNDRSGHRAPSHAEKK